ncbi:putative translation initiation factor IF-2 [uncultured archaeon]|nr:putative translation initiation factor IF-2 [uncultured archaeon]
MSDLNLKTREPIISVLGHVDHGKTTLLDYVRSSTVASREAGGITQHIGATGVPFEVIEKLCKGKLKKEMIKIPLQGLLFIDTPGHEAFTTLRKRGGSVADLAILVVDVNEGMKPQTLEALQILKQYKTPFVVAANKIDAIHGWQKDVPFSEQNERVQKEFNDKFYKLVGDLSIHGFNCEHFTRVSDFRKEVCIIPISAQTGEGVPHLLMTLIGLAQTYLKEQLEAAITSPGKGVILEVKEDVGLGATIDVILYDGIIHRGDSIVVGAHQPFVTKVKALLRPKSLDEMRDPREKFKNVESVYAAYGVKISAPGLEKAMAGAPVYVGGDELIEQVKGEIGEIEFTKSEKGVFVKADTLGGLEALIKILSDKKIPVKHGSIGKVTKQDVVEAQAVSHEDPTLGVVLAFHTQVLPQAKSFAEDNCIKLFSNPIIYQLIDDYEVWRLEKTKAQTAQHIKTHVSPVKFKILPDFVFRTSKPAIVGVEILAGTLRVGIRLLTHDGRVVGYLKGIQKDNEKVESAAKGEKVAVSMDDIVIGRNLMETDVVYGFMSDEDVQASCTVEQTDDEKQTLREIREIKKRRIMAKNE